MGLDVWIYVDICVCMHVCVSLYICICIYIFICMGVRAGSSDPPLFIDPLTALSVF